MNKSHLIFRNPEEGLVEYKSRPGGGGNEEDEEEKDYTYMANVLSECEAIFYSDIEDRHANRTLDLPVHFDLIQIDFFGAFNQPEYEGYYSNTFGLALLHLSRFNRRGLFAIDDQERFEHFFRQINAFVDRIIKDSDIEYDGKVKYIREFKLFSNNDMIGNIDNFSIIHLSLLGKGLIEESLINPQKRAFTEYLTENKIEFKYNDHELELYNISEQILNDIVGNFDFIYASCSGSGAIIQPGRYNTPEREFGFEISNAETELPIIGIIDTGISEETPLAPLLIGKNGDFDTTQSGSFIDNTDHGTGVAAFAAFGEKLIPGYRGEVEADAKLLSIKILDSNHAAISQNKIIELIKRAYNEYRVRIFTLTIGYSDFPIESNQEISSYARMLDELTYELDILIFISTTNNIFEIQSPRDYPDKFVDDSANIASPAESINNITIGAIADNYINDNLKSLAPSKEFPAMYSRKLHYDFDDKDLFNAHTGNQYIRKPDILLAGGDYTEFNFLGETEYDYGGESGLEVLSSNLTERTYYAIGTSYSAPLAANIAAKLVKLYPDLDMQSIKALLINSSERIKSGDIFDDISNCLQNRIMGYGNLNKDVVQYSDENRVTMIIEDEIYPGHLKTFPLHLPEYLNGAIRRKGLLKIDATLCFKFFPKADSQLLYCPFHVTFAIGKNLQLEEFRREEKIQENGKRKEIDVPYGYNGNSSTKIKLNSGKGWVQDYYYKGKITSNVQKTTINIKRDNIIDENNCFKVAVNAAYHKLLTDAEKEPYLSGIPFSLVITIEQFPAKNEVLPSLYDELILSNRLETIADIELDLTN